MTDDQLAYTIGVTLAIIVLVWIRKIILRYT